MINVHGLDVDDILLLILQLLYWLSVEFFVIFFVFLPLFSERQTKRTMNKLRFAVDVKKEYIVSSPRIFNYAKHVVFFFSLGVALGEKCSQVVKLIKACNYPALF